MLAVNDDAVSHRPGDSPWVWAWVGNTLWDRDDRAIASVRCEVIYVDGQRLLVEFTPGSTTFRFRATSSSGEMFRVHQKGLSTHILRAECGARGYTLQRWSRWRKDRAIRDSEGKLCGFVRPRAVGRVEIENGPHHDALPTLDAVVLTWACVLADSPTRELRY